MLQAVLWHCRCCGQCCDQPFQHNILHDGAAHAFRHQLDLRMFVCQLLHVILRKLEKSVGQALVILWSNSGQTLTCCPCSHLQR
jgi:hypothetical protein